MKTLRTLPADSMTSRQRRISEGFSRAAASYDNEAVLQRQVADALLDSLPAACRPGTLLDVGCGTGYVASRLVQRFDAAAIGLDLAPGMLEVARRRHAGLPIRWIAGSAERLPLAGRSLDLVASSLALQWCDSLHGFLRQAARVLRPHGWLAFTTLCAGSLEELRQAWRAVDSGRHVNDFPTESALHAALAQPGWRLHCCDVVTRHTWHADTKSALRSLKRIGANTVTVHPAAKELSGRHRLSRLAGALETFRETSGIPTRYRVATVVMERHDTQD